MSKSVKIMLVALLSVLFVGCAGPLPRGSLFTGVTMPVAATDSASSIKVGEATCTSILGLIAIGDCSVLAAKKAGRITKVSSVDWKVKNILGLVGEYTTVVRGQ